VTGSREVTGGRDVTGGRELTRSERDWLRVRRYLQDHRYELGVAAASRYPGTATIAGSPLLAAPGWLPPAPIPLAGIGLEFRPQAAAPRVTGSGEAARQVLPRRPDGRRYRRYSEAVGALAAPGTFEDRPTYRLHGAGLAGPHPRLVFGRGSYFDGVDTGEASAHEYAAARGGTGEPGLRDAIGDPCDLASRPANLAISTLTIRCDRRSGRASMLLHWRDPAKVGHAGGLYQVVPVGVFQPSGYAPWNEANDFSLWRCMLREFAEELGGGSEDYGSEQAPIGYATWPFGARLTGALEAGDVRSWCLGLGTDPLTFATDLLTVAVFDAPVFDDLFGTLRPDNPEGRLLHIPDVPSPDGPAGEGGSAIAFTAETVSRFTADEPMQAAGAALLALAWQHRRTLLS
jgi:hypothetical protein